MKFEKTGERKRVLQMISGCIQDTMKLMKCCQLRTISSSYSVYARCKPSVGCC